jgi:hypothetical protein
MKRVYRFAQGKAMLFHITQVHTAESCFAHKPETLKSLATSLKSADEQGVHVHSFYVTPWEHTFYLVVETESADSLDRWLDPMLELTTARITPVLDGLAMAAKLVETGKRL